MVAIGTVPDSDFQDMQRPLDPQPARVVKLPLVSIDARAELTLSELDEKPVAFSRSEIDEGRVKTVSSTGRVTGAAASLAHELEIAVNVLGLAVNMETLTSVVGETGALAAPAPDPVLP